MVKRILISSFVTIVTLLQADNIVKYHMDDDNISFMYKNPTTSKMVTYSEDGKVEIYNINNNSYIVSYTNKGMNIVDLNAMKAKINDIGLNPSMFMQHQEKKPKFTIKETGNRVVIAGIKGEEWIVKGYEDGKNYETKVVVTNNRNVVNTMSAMFTSLSNMSGGNIPMDNLFEIKKGYVIIQADGMKLESFKIKSLPNTEYILPNKETIVKKETIQERNKINEPSPQKEDNFGISEENIDKAVDLFKSLF